MLKVGLILYSVREEMAKDPIVTVEKVGQLGYTMRSRTQAADLG